MSEKLEELLNNVLKDGEDEFIDLEEASIIEEMRDINNRLIIRRE